MKPLFTHMLTGPNPVVARFVAERLGEPEIDFGRFNTLAFVDSRGIKVALVYNGFNFPSVSLHVGARPGALWCHKSVLFHIFTYPFEEMRVARVTAPVKSTNTRSIRLVTALGFMLEGTLRRAGRAGEDIHLYGMLKEECRWL